jgi:MoxR-like ATPase
VQHIPVASQPEHEGTARAVPSPEGPGAASAAAARQQHDGFTAPEDLRAALATQAYLADRGLATGLYLALALNRPLLLEGEAGVGKTEVAKALAALLGRDLIRLQCFEGIDASQALYEWDYARQLIAVRAAQSGALSATDLFAPEFLAERPLLSALRAGDRAVLLIDELDRADDEFEAFLLEVLSEFAVTIPEVGRVAAERPPAVVITSNRTRELHDALKRRCLYHWIDHPTLEREVEIVQVRAPEVPETLAREVAAAVGRLRGMDVSKRPGVAETIDWAQALAFLGITHLDADAALATLGAVVKDHEDAQLVRGRLGELLGKG